MSAIHRITPKSRDEWLNLRTRDVTPAAQWPVAETPKSSLLRRMIDAIKGKCRAYAC